MINSLQFIQLMVLFIYKMEWLSESLPFSLILLISVIVILLYFGTSTYDFWKNLGVPYKRPTFPLFGNSFETLFNIKTVAEVQLETYNFFKGEKFGGIFRFMTPSLFLRDPKLIERILIKDFVHFYNRTETIDFELDGLSSHLVNLENEQWKSLRNKLTPTFTSGKLKGMHQQLLDCSNELIQVIAEYADGKPIEAKEVMSKFTTDVIGSCAFGLNTNAMKPDSDFRKIGRKFFEITFWGKLRRGLRSRCPWLLRIFKWRSIPEKVEHFFISTINRMLDYREKNGIKRADFLHLLNELRKQDINKTTKDDKEFDDFYRMEWISESLPLSLLLLISVIVILLYFGTSTYDFWKNLGVPYKKPTFPLFGNSFETLFNVKTVAEDQLETYNFFKGEKFGGIFRFMSPSLFLRDPELIERILIKDFVHFYNRTETIDIELDGLSANLVNLENEQWKSLRNKLTPTFSSGKLKGMHQQLLDCSNELIQVMAEYTDGKPFEAKEVMSKFTTDVIGSCAFGLNTNAMKPDSDFRKIGRKFFEITFWGKLRRGLSSRCPWLLRILKWRSIPEKVEHFFISTINRMLDYREKNGIKRADFLHLLNELRKQDINKTPNDDKEFIFTERVMVSNAFVFFVAGFETTASTLSYVLYELAVNQDIQEKAHQEVMAIFKKHGNALTFEAIKDMTYLEQIVSETLRKHPPAPGTARITTKPYQMPDTSTVLPKGTVVVIPIYALHHDPEYYPEPDKFLPERFSENNSIVKGTYLPFGDGPRICIGLRFAKLEIKIGISQMLMNYRFTLNKKTISPLQYDKRAFLLVPVGGIWLHVHKRN